LHGIAWAATALAANSSASAVVMKAGRLVKVEVILTSRLQAAFRKR
jgi:hypothetical protein